MSKETGGTNYRPASPGADAVEYGSGPSAEHRIDMTLRDYFAAQALQGMLCDPGLENTPQETARLCYRVADAMLAERAK